MRTEKTFELKKFTSVTVPFKAKHIRKIYSFENSKKLWSQAKQVIAGGTTGTCQPLYSEFPAFFTRAKGCRMWDADGNEFIDLLCSIGPVILGYAYDRVDNAAHDIIKSSFQSSTSHPIIIELAKELIQIIPSAEKVQFFKTGSDATTAAARLARHVTNRMYIARCGYHGWHDIWRNGMEGGTDPKAWESVPAFDGTAEGLDELFRQTKEEFAAVILCPADTKPFTKENYQGIIDVAHKHGALVIFDEIKTGFRTALGGAQELLSVMPDLTTVSKALGNGYPVAALAGKAEYMDEFPNTLTGGTFVIEALSITAALATLKELKEKNVVAHLHKVGQQLINGLNEICQTYGMEEPKAYGDPVPSMPRFTWKPGTDHDASHPAHQYFFGECLRYGLFFSPGHVAFVNYSHSHKDIDEALDICDYVMAKTKRNWNNFDTKMIV